MADPLSGQRIDTERAPVWVEDVTLLGDGLAYLRRNAEFIQPTLLASSHEKATDLGDMQTQWFEKQVRSGDFYGFEGWGYNEEVMKPVLAEAAKVAPLIALRGLGHVIETYSRLYAKRNQGRPADTFNVRRNLVMAQPEVHSFAMDVVSNGTPVEQALLEATKQIFTHPDPEIMSMANIGHGNLRE